MEMFFRIINKRKRGEAGRKGGKSDGASSLFASAESFDPDGRERKRKRIKEKKRETRRYITSFGRQSNLAVVKDLVLSM
jgi:hypothetical protein